MQAYLLPVIRKKRVGGVKKRLWIGNISELESIAYVGDDPKGAILDFTMAYNYYDLCI